MNTSIYTLLDTTDIVSYTSPRVRKHIQRAPRNLANVNVWHKVLFVVRSSRSNKGIQVRQVVLAHRVPVDFLLVLCQPVRDLSQGHSSLALLVCFKDWVDGGHCDKATGGVENPTVFGDFNEKPLGGKSARQDALVSLGAAHPPEIYVSRDPS